MSRLPPTPSRPSRPPARPRQVLRPADPERPNRTDVRPAGRVLAVMVGALLVGAVLNAQALLHDARSKPLGPGRTVSVAIWTPVARVAAAFGLDRPRNTAETALGRIDADPAVTVTVPAAPPGTGSGADVGHPAPGSPAGAPVTGTRAPELRVASPAEPLRVLLVGDSSMTAVGGALTRALSATGVATARLDARPATGFSRPDFFDWPSRLATLVRDGSTELTIAMFGANDAQGFEHGGHVHDFGSESWIAIYRARVATAMDLLSTGGSQVIWIGEPAMRSASFDARMRVIDDIVRAEAAARPAVRYVDARSLLAGPDGGYAEYLTLPGGERTRVRDGDGIHLTTAGADLVAADVLEPVVARIRPAGPDLATAGPPPGR
jgi:uncharacterized protein